MNTSTADRRRALALRAFPPRWRERHGDELLHVSGELASSSHHHSGWRELVDIVRGGLAVRIEDRPPIRVRIAYRWFEKPVPARWHAWIRDDLRGRFLGYRRNLRAMLPVWGMVVYFAATGMSGGSQFLVSSGVLFAMLIAGGPYKARLVRKRMNAKVGYDVVAAGPFPPATVMTPPVLRRPARRAPFVRYAVPFAVWSSISGVALIAGAAISNAPNRSIGPFTLSPDPNSPLTTRQVGVISVAVAIVAVAVGATTALVVRRRMRNLEATTAHETLPLSAHNTWLATSILGVLATLIGALGVMPDLACAVIGACLVVTGTASGVAAVPIARRDAELGRRISLAELFVGERDPLAHNGQRPAAVSDR